MWLGFSAQFSDDDDTEVSREPAVHTNKRDDHFGSKGSPGVAAEKKVCLIGWIGRSYLVGLAVVEIWGQFLHPLFFGDKLPFLPLMLMSIYCAFGIMYSWIWQLKSIVKSP